MINDIQLFFNAFLKMIPDLIILLLGIVLLFVMAKKLPKEIVKEVFIKTKDGFIIHTSSNPGNPLDCVVFYVTILLFNLIFSFLFIFFAKQNFIFNIIKIIFYITLFLCFIIETIIKLKKMKTVKMDLSYKKYLYIINILTIIIITYILLNKIL